MYNIQIPRHTSRIPLHASTPLRGYSIDNEPTHSSAVHPQPPSQLSPSSLRRAAFRISYKILDCVHDSKTCSGVSWSLLHPVARPRLSFLSSPSTFPSLYSVKLLDGPHGFSVAVSWPLLLLSVLSPDPDPSSLVCYHRS